MIAVIEQPPLLDYIKVCAKMPSDERAQLEAFTGHDYDIDGAAVGNFTVPGPKWGIYWENDPVIVGGFVLQRPGVWRDFMISTPDAWAHWHPVTRIVGRIMDSMFAIYGAHRVECIAPEDRLVARPEIRRWYRHIGYRQEAVLEGYCANKGNAVLFSRRV